MRKAETSKFPLLCFPNAAHGALPAHTQGAALPGEQQLVIQYLGLQSKVSCWGSGAPAVACGVWESLNYGRVGICVEEQAAASAWHWEEKESANPRAPGVMERKLVWLQRQKNHSNSAFLSLSPPNRQVEEKQEKPTRNVVFIFVSASPHFSFLLSTYIKKVLKGTKRKQKSSWINHNTNFWKWQFCLCVTSSLPLTHQSWPASIRSWICPGQRTSE